MGFGHEKLDMYRACRLGLPIMKTRRSTQQGSIPIPIPTPMENMNRRIANHGLEATPKGAWCQAIENPQTAFQGQTPGCPVTPGPPGSSPASFVLFVV